MESSSESVILITLDSCRFDSFRKAKAPNLKSIGPLHCAQAPSYFTYGSHAAIWMGFTPGLTNSKQPWLNPKAGKLFRMANAGFIGDTSDGIKLTGPNIIEGFRRSGYRTIGTGAVGWFDPSTETGAILGDPFDDFFYPGNTWSLKKQLMWIEEMSSRQSYSKPVFIFLNIGETHVPYWHEDAEWAREPSPCIPFGGKQCSRRKSRRQQIKCIEWVDEQVKTLIKRYSSDTIIMCADHGDCWGEDGLWEHGVSHWATLTVPLLMRVKGIPVINNPK